jgi:hypothetical protein
MKAKIVWHSISVPRDTRKALEVVATAENRTVPRMIDELVDFWRERHCPECGRESTGSACICRRVGV